MEGIKPGYVEDHITKGEGEGDEVTGGGRTL